MRNPIWVIFLLVSTASSILAPFSSALTDDGFALLELKSSFNDTKNVLSNWVSTDETPCYWTGITCNDDAVPRVRSINLPYMQIGGTLSPSIGKLSRLQRLALHQNSLHGTIPNELLNCTELRALYLRGNFLQGEIPAGIGTLQFLTILDLSSNQLKGSVPASIGRLTRLQLLNLSTNFLSGEIPDTGVLSTFGSNLFSGNRDLCGRQLNKACRDSMGFPAVVPHAESDNAAVPVNQPPSSSHYLRYAVIGALSFVSLFLVSVIILLWICLPSRKERAAKKYTEVKKQVLQEPSTKLITFHGDLPYPSFEIIEKLELLNDEDIVGSGGFGTVYRMVMNDCATFAVKRIDRSREARKEQSKHLFTQAFEKAWNNACSMKNGVVLEVPRNKKFLLGPTTFSGPCKSSITLKVYGTILASADRSDYEKVLRHWIIFDSIKNFHVLGGGTFDGNGNIWWKNSCKIDKSKPCKNAPTKLILDMESGSYEASWRCVFLRSLSLPRG